MHVDNFDLHIPNFNGKELKMCTDVLNECVHVFKNPLEVFAFQQAAASPT